LPDQIAAIKFFRLELSNGVIAGSAATKTVRTRRDNLLQISVVEKRQSGRGTEEEYSVTVCGLALVYAVEFIREPMAFAYVELVKSTADRDGKYGLPERRGGMDCFSALGGRRRFFLLVYVDGVVGTLRRDAREHGLFHRTPFSNM